MLPHCCGHHRRVALTSLVQHCNGVPMRSQALGTRLSVHVDNCAFHVAFASWGIMSFCISAILLRMHQRDMHHGKAVPAVNA